MLCCDTLSWRSEGPHVTPELPPAAGPPVVVLLEDTSVPAGVETMKRGAWACIEARRPDAEILPLLLDAAEEERRRHAARLHRQEVAERFARLTPRQLQVFDGLLDGDTSRSLATRMGISKKTVDFHRSEILARLEVSTLVEAAVLACSRVDGGAARALLRSH